MAELLAQVWIVVALVFGFGLLVLIHEYGHFLMARRAGIRVEAFSIGFGKVLWSWRRGETEYRVSLLPLGGYVKMTGEDPDDPESAKDPRGYAAQSLWARARVILAGPLMNLWLALVLMPLPFIIGRERPYFEQAPAVVEEVRPRSAAALAGLQPGDRLVAVDQQPVTSWAEVQDAMVLAGQGALRVEFERAGRRYTEILRANRWGLGIHPSTFVLNRPTIDGVQPGSPAATAGLQVGDRVQAVAGQPIQYWDELSLALSRGRSLWFWLWAQREWAGDLRTGLEYVAGGPLELTVVRGAADARPQVIAVEPRYDESLRRTVIGISHDTERAWADVPKVVKRYPLGAAIVHGVQEIGRLTRLMGDFLARLVHAPSEHYSSLAGPVRIFSMFAQIASEGLSPYLYFLSFFSLQLGLLNLLPIPVLDGGHLVFLIAEGIARRPLPLRVRAAIQYAGLAFLLSLFLLVTINDLGSFAWVRNLVSRLF